MMFRGEAYDHGLSMIEQATSEEGLGGVVKELRDLYAVANLTYHGLRGVGGASDVILTTIDPAWPKRYAEREYVQIDPVVREARQASLPVDWSEVDDTPARAKRYFFELARFEVGSKGLSIPLLTPAGEAGLFSFTANVSDGEWLPFRRKREADLVLLGQHIHVRSLEIWRGLPQKLSLPRQPRKCLEFLANGYSAIDIGDLMDLSVHTVRMHIKTAQQKLGCNSRTEAVSKALQLGLITKKARMLPFLILADFLTEGMISDNFVALFS